MKPKSTLEFHGCLTGDCPHGKQSECDAEVRIVQARMPDEFTEKVNAVLRDGGWRVAETEMSVTDHHYRALLIRSDNA